MPWWSSAYLIVLVIFCAAGFFDDFQKREPWWHLFFDIISAIASIAFILSFWHSQVAQTFGSSLIFILTFTVIWDSWSAYRDVTHAKSDSQFTQKENSYLQYIGIMITVLISFPAYCFGAFAVYDNFRIQG